MYNIVKNYPRYETINSKDLVKKLFNSRRLLDLPAPNTCAIRVSEALNKAGFIIDGTILPKNEYEKGKNDKWYVLTAMGMKRYLEKNMEGLLDILLILLNYIEDFVNILMYQDQELLYYSQILKALQDMLIYGLKKNLLERIIYIINGLKKFIFFQALN